MSWTAPRTWVTGEVETTGIFNRELRDNIGFSGRRHDHSGDPGDGADLSHFVILSSQVFGAHRTDAR